MKFHPIISIILGTITAFMITSIAMFKPNALFDTLFRYIFPFLIGGFIATYFAKEKKTRYGIYVGIIYFIILFIPPALADISDYTVFLLGLILFLILVIIPAGIGGFLGKMTDENNRQTFKTKNLNMNFHPILTVIIGIFVTFFIGILSAIIINFFDPNSLTRYWVTLIGGSLIGGFIATYFTKEKKIRYGIYVGICVVIIELLLDLYIISTGNSPNPDFFNPVTITSLNAGYLIAPTIGAYLGITVYKRLK